MSIQDPPGSRWVLRPFISTERIDPGLSRRIRSGVWLRRGLSSRMPLSKRKTHREDESRSKNEGKNILRSAGCFWSYPKNAFKKNTFWFIDLPYYEKGKELYSNPYGPDGHASLANVVRTDLNATNGFWPTTSVTRSRSSMKDSCILRSGLGIAPGAKRIATESTFFNGLDVSFSFQKNRTVPCVEQNKRPWGTTTLMKKETQQKFWFSPWAAPVFHESQVNY